MDEGVRWRVGRGGAVGGWCGGVVGYVVVGFVG